MASKFPLFIKSLSSRIADDALFKLMGGSQIRSISHLPSTQEGDCVRIEVDSLTAALQIGAAAMHTIQDCTVSTKEENLLLPTTSVFFSHHKVNSPLFLTGQVHNFLPHLQSKGADPCLSLIAERDRFVSTHSLLFQIYQRRVRLLEKGHSTMVTGPFYLPITTAQLPFSDRYSTLEEATDFSREIFRESMYGHFNRFFFEQKISYHLLLPEELDLIKMTIDDWSHHALHRAFSFTNGIHVHGDSYLAEVATSIGVKGEKTNASRFFVGAPYPTNEMTELMQLICKKRKVGWQDQYSPYALGYDLEENIFKVYYRAKKSQAPQDLLSLAPKDKTYRDNVLISYSYDLLSGKLREEKLYLHNIKEEITLLLTNKRGVLYQYDAVPTREENREQKYLESNEGIKMWMEKLNDKGKIILSNYEDQGALFAGIEYENPNKFKLYFPHLF